VGAELALTAAAGPSQRICPLTDPDTHPMTGRLPFLEIDWGL
jgi:hypothetical protein